MADTIGDREAFGLWQLEYNLADGLLRQVEQAERAILTKLGWPIDPVAIYATLTGETPTGVGVRSSAADKRRVRHAMHVLLLAGRARGSFSLGAENARWAAYHALLCGLYANDAAVNAAIAFHIEAGRPKGARASKRKRQRSAIQRHAGLRRKAAKLNPNLSTMAKARILALTSTLSADRIRHIIK